MEILIFGGTRFIGKRFVRNCLKKKYAVTCVSRRDIEDHRYLTKFRGERNALIDQLKNKSFDFIFDFIGYDCNSVLKTLNNLKFQSYIFISSSWISQYDDELRKFNQRDVKYIRGKKEVEKLLLEQKPKSRNFNIIRFPIILGMGDFSGRLDYFASRLSKGLPVILPNSGRNKTKICYVNDAALALESFISFPFLNRYKIYEALPNDSITIQELVQFAADKLNSVSKFIPINKETLLKHSPKFLEMEPFCRETVYNNNLPNIFKETRTPLTSYKKWIGDCLDNYSVETSTLKSTCRDYKWDNDIFKKMERDIINVKF